TEASRAERGSGQGARPQEGRPQQRRHGHHRPDEEGVHHRGWLRPDPSRRGCPRRHPQGGLVMKKRISFAVTQDVDKAAARYPWAASFIKVKGGFWCFESKKQADTFRASRNDQPTPGPHKGP